MMGLGKCHSPFKYGHHFGYLWISVKFLGMMMKFYWCIFFEWVLQPSTSYCLPLRLTEQEDSRRQNRCASRTISFPYMLSMHDIFTYIHYQNQRNIDTVDIHGWYLLLGMSRLLCHVLTWSTFRKSIRGNPGWYLSRGSPNFAETFLMKEMTRILRFGSDCWNNGRK